MNQNVIVMSFADESRAFRALAELKAAAAAGDMQLQTAAVVQRSVEGTFSVRNDEADDMALAARSGTLLDSVLGLLAGPLGMLLGGGYGELFGRSDNKDAAQGRISVVDQMMQAMPPGSTSLIATAGEKSPDVLDALARQLSGVVLRRPHAVVQEEISAAEEASDAAAREVRRILRDKKSAQWHNQFDNWKEEIDESLARLESNICDAFGRGVA